MKYIIDPEYSFCGWDGLPFALTAGTGRPVFLSREQFLLLWSCDGRTEIDRESLGDTAAFFAKAVKNGVVREAPEGIRLQLHEYRRYPCRYRSDVQLSITGRCNYKCRHCFQSAPHGVLGQPTAEEVCRELDQLAECGVRNVAVTGGEPLIHEGFWTIIDHMTELGLNLTTMYSNGRLIDQKLLDGFKQRGLRPGWSVSFDGLGQHDYIRGVKGAEEAAVAAIKLLVANGFPVACAYVLTKRTVPVFRETVNFLATLGVHSVKSGYTQPQGEWLNCTDEWLTDEEYLAFYKEYIPQYLADGRPVNLQFEGLFSGMSDASLRMSAAERESLRTADDCGTADDTEDGKEPAPYAFFAERHLTEEQCGKTLACGVLGTSFYIGPTGRVLPCMSLDATPVSEEFPTLWEVPLKEILSDGSRFIQATGYTVADVFAHNEECRGCEARSFCCAGCRAGAVGADGDDYLTLDKRTCLLCKDNWAGHIREAIDSAQNPGAL